MLLINLTVVLAAAQPLPLPLRYEKLDNGLQLVVVEDHTLPLVRVQLWYRVGSANDPPDKSGLTHVAHALLEHQGDAALRIRASGARFESGTLRDAVYFATLAPPNFLDYVLKIEARRMRRVEVTPQRLDQALNAVSTSASAADGVLEADDERRLLAAMFPDHPYRHPPAFVAESLADVTPQVMQRHLNTWFVPGNATLLVIGDIESIPTIDLARRLFADLPWRQPPRRRENMPRPPDETIEITGDAHAIAWLTPPLGLFENAAVDVLMQRLCNPVDGPPYQRLAAAGYEPPRWERRAWRDAGMLVLWAEPADSAATATRVHGGLAELVRDALTAARETVPTPIEHNRARALAKRDLRRQLATFSRRATARAAFEVVGGNLLLGEIAPQRIDAVTVGDVQAAADLLLQTRTVVMHRAPASSARTSEIGGTPSAPLPQPISSRDAERIDPFDAIERLALAAPSVPSIGPVQTPGQLINETVAPGVTAAICAVAGLEPAAVRIVTEVQFSNRYLAEGLLRSAPRMWSAEQRASYLTYHGLVLRSCNSNGRLDLSGCGSSSQVGSLLEILARAVAEPDIDAAARAAAQLIVEAGRAATDSPAQLHQFLAEFGALRTLEQWRADRTADFRREYQKLASMRDVRVFVAGDVDEEPVLSQIREEWTSVVADAANEARPQPARDTKEALTPIAELETRVDQGLDQVRVTATLALPGRQDGQDRRAADAVRWLLCPPTVREALAPGAVWGSPWSATTDGRILHARYAGESEAVSEFLERLIVPFGRLRTGDVSERTLARAAHLARVQRLVELESSAAILNALEAGARNPWEVHAAETRAQLRTWIECYLSRTTLEIRCICGDQVQADRIRERFDALLGEVETSP